MRREWNDINLVMEDEPSGLRINFSGHSYIARKWRLTPKLEQLIETALQAGFTSVLPPHVLKKGAADAEYIALGDPESKIGAIFLDGSSSDGSGDRNNLFVVCFFKGLQAVFTRNNVPWVWQFHGGQNLFVPYDAALFAIENHGREIMDFVTAVRSKRKKYRLGRRRTIVSEADLEALILELLQQRSESLKALLTDHSIIKSVRSQMRFDIPGSPGKSAIPDILVHIDDEVVIVELKVGRADAPAIAQVASYMANRNIQDLTGEKRVRGCLIARGFGPISRQKVEDEFQRSGGQLVELFSYSGNASEDFKLRNETEQSVSQRTQ